MSVLDHMLNEGIIDKNMEHHLLGCSLPQEYTQYLTEDYNWITSMDTSSPVLIGMDYERYDDNGGLSYKSDSLLFERIDEQVYGLSKEIVLDNIDEFRKTLKQEIIW
jgi:hypothetical protein